MYCLCLVVGVPKPNYQHPLSCSSFTQTSIVRSRSYQTKVYYCLLAPCCIENRHPVILRRFTSSHSVFCSIPVRQPYTPPNVLSSPFFFTNLSSSHIVAKTFTIHNSVERYRCARSTHWVRSKQVETFHKSAMDSHRDPQCGPIPLQK